MKYSLFFAAAVAAYDPYGAAPASSAPAKISSAPSYDYDNHGYGGQPSSAPSKPSSSAPAYNGYPVSSAVKSSTPASRATPCSTVVGSNGYTTIVPGYGKPPVTVTQQHQSYPTCVAKGYDGKSCDKWEDDKYVSTVVTDCNKKVVTVTKVDDYLTVYQEKKTITHSATPTVGGYGAVSTGIAGAKDATGVWYELYEKVILCKYAECGKNVLVGYTGSGLCQKCNDEQPVTQKVYSGGKWTEEKKTLNYGKPKDEVKVYEKPGVYTVPAKVVTVYKSEATGSGKPSYDAGIYHIPAKVITITQANQPYTCTYELSKQTPSKTPSKGEDKPATKTPTYNDYGYKASGTPSSTPKKPSNDYPSYHDSPKSNSTSAYKPSSTPCESDKKSTATPVIVSKPVYGDNSKPSSTPAAYYGDNSKASSFAPSKPSSTPAAYYPDNSKPSYTPVAYHPDNKHSSSSPSKPSSTPCESSSAPSKPSSTSAAYYGDNSKASSFAPSKPSSTPAAYYPDNSKPSYTPVAYHPDNKPSSSSPSKPTSTPCDDDLKAKPTLYNNGGYVAPSPTHAAHVYNNAGNYGEAAKPTPTPAKAAYGGYAKRANMMERRNAAIEA